MDPKKHKNLLDKKNVVAVAKGEKWTNGQNTGEEALLVFVEKKIPKSQLTADDLIPDKIDGDKTDVVGKTGAIEALNLVQRIRPIPGGYSCGHIKITAGTLGGWFIDKDGDLVGLSNNHVLTHKNKATRSDIILQPGIYDRSNWTNNRIGNLKSFVKLVRNNNLQDAAIVKLSKESWANPETHIIGQPAGFNDHIKVGDTVQKVGRTTGRTTANVIATNGVVRVQYGWVRRGTLEFEDQIITSDMSRGGDSGSLLMDMNNNIVGLLFAGSNTITIHNKIRYPREKWGLEIYNPSPLSETYTATLTINGVDEISSDVKGFDALVVRARELAKEGKTVSLNVSYQVNQI
jgi:hypothetical protein